MKIKFSQGNGLIYANLLRHTALTTTKSLRPIAVSVENSNILTTGWVAVEDMITFCNNIAASRYSYSGTDEFVEVEVQVNRIMTYKDLVTKDIGILGSITSTEILHTLSDEPVKVMVYFRYTNGSHSSNENILSLRKSFSWVEESKVAPLNTQHSNIKKFNFLQEKFVSEPDEFEFDIETFDGSSDTEVLVNAVKRISEDLSLAI